MVSLCSQLLTNIHPSAPYKQFPWFYRLRTFSAYFFLGDVISCHSMLHSVFGLQQWNSLLSSVTMPWRMSSSFTAYWSCNCEETFFPWSMCHSVSKWGPHKEQNFHHILWHGVLFQSLPPFPCYMPANSFQWAHWFSHPIPLVQAVHGQQLWG